ncbi:MAG: lysozyme inhibitor LprI family protein [Gemmatimonadaceae bacterium]
MRRPAVVACVLFLVVLGCSRDSGKTPDELLAEDTTLAIDLARANDALDYGEPDTSIGLTDDAPPLIPDQDPAPRTASSESDARNSRDADLRAAAPPRAESAPRRPPPAPPAQQQPAPVRVAASAEGCASPAVADQRRCLLSLLSQYDVSLNSAYRDVIQRMRRNAGVAAGEPDPASVRELRAAQRSWLVYRDQECRRRTRSREGELWAPVRARCLGELSDVRAAVLRAM